MSDSTPLNCYRTIVGADWIDVNGHMNAQHYYTVVYRAHVVLTERLGLGDAYVAARQCGKVVVESHHRFERELRLNDPLEVRSRLLGVDAKRLHFFHEIWNARDGYRAGTGEQIDVHVDLRTRRGAPFAPDVRARLQAVADAHAALPRPPGAGFFDARMKPLAGKR
ncbi:MAG: thioesterase family protein [Myxococcota bacterium]